ncbi:MAG TPA: hypothetical protein VGM13_08330 [Thermoanaerobaculia bacterium]|jgi:hypothetical protein
MLESAASSGLDTLEDSEPVVVFRSSNPVECASVASALSDAGLQAWVHDDPSLHLGYGTEWLEASVGRPSCVSVPAHSRVHALRIIGGLFPNTLSVQQRASSDPVHGLGHRVTGRGRLIAWLALAALTLWLVYSVARLWRGHF